MSTKKRIDGEKLVSAVTYVCLLAVFTYTPLLIALMTTGVEFLPVYNNSQGAYVALFVNVGLLLMLFIDYIAGKRLIHKKHLIGTLVAICGLIGVSALASNACSESPIALAWILGWPFFGVVMHGAFLIYLMYVKYVSYPSQKMGARLQESYN